MRKQVQKERCTKIMLSKCKSVCHLYDKVQLAAARMLDAEPSVCSFVCNVPVGVDVPADDLNLPSETYTTDFVIQYDDGHTAVREAVFRAHLNNRNDIKVMAGWVVTAPQNLDPKRYDDFFCSTYDFLENRYGKENVIQAIVHDDEGGQPHLHFCFVPVVEDPKHDEGYKVCANEVLDRRELRNFHPDLQRYLDEHGLEDAHIMTGVTKQQGGNRTVAQLKAEREQEIKRPSLYFGEATNMQHLHF